jgi:hypothetical protein
MMRYRHKPSILAHPIEGWSYGQRQRPTPETPRLVNGIIGSIPGKPPATMEDKANKVIDKQFNK